MNARYRAVVVGAGSIGERHVRCMLATRLMDVAICESDEAVRTRMAGKYALAATYARDDDAAGERFDFAVIATPAPLHIKQASKFVAHGTHVLIEKPLSINLDGVAELRQLIENKSLTACVAFPYRAHPSLAAMKSAIALGRFGRPLEVVTVAGQHFPTYRPAYRDTYYSRRETGGGAIQDALPHLVNAVEWLVGPSERVVADAARLSLEGVEVEDTIHVLARHSSVLASYSLNQHQPANETTITVVCERGQARFEYHRSRWSWLTEVDGEWHVESAGDLERDDIFRRQIAAFVNAMKREERPLCSFDEGIGTLKSVLSILRSLETLRWELLPN